MGLTYEQLYDFIPRVFWNALDGYIMQEENRERANWIRCRWQTCLLLNIHLPKRKQLRQERLIKFDWEKNYVKMDYKTEVKKIKNWQSDWEYRKALLKMRETMDRFNINIKDSDIN